MSRWVDLARACVVLLLLAIALPGGVPRPARAQDAPVPLPPSDGNRAPADTLPYDDEAEFRAAMDAFTAGRYAEAASRFEAVSTRSADASRRTTAATLAAEARARASATGDGALPAVPPGYAGGAYGGGVGPRSTMDDERSPEVAAPQEGPGQEPRAALLAATTFLGLGYWGWSTPYALGLEEDGRAFVGTYLLVAAASFFGPFLLTMPSPPTWGTAALAIHGGFNGFWHGALLYSAVAASLREFDDRALIASMLLMSLFETFGGYALASQTRMDAGRAHAIHTGALLGAGALAGLTFTLGGDAFDDASVPLWLAVAGMVGGGVGGALLTDHMRLTWGDVHAVEVAATLGVYLGAVVALDADLSDTRGYAALTTLGGVGGAVLGGFLVAGKDLRAWQGLVLQAATILSGFFGAGLVFVLGGDDLRLITTAGVVTAAAGFGLSLLAFDIPREVPEGRDGDASLAAVLRSLAIAPWIDVERGSRGLALSGRF